MPKTIKVEVTNRTARFVSRYNYDKLIKYWSYAVNSFIYMSRPWYRNCKICRRTKQAHPIGDIGHRYTPIWDGKIKLLKNDMVPAGLFWATYKEIEKKEHIRFELDHYIDRGIIGRGKKHWVLSEGKYTFQNKCADKVVDKICYEGRGGLVLNATGSGKTRIVAMVASRLDADILFIVDQLDLLEQARKDIRKHLGEKIGKVGESKFRPRRITVATIQTLHRHRNSKRFKKWFAQVPVICIDEIHVALSRSNFDVVKVAKPLAVIGLTATLQLSKKDVRLKAFSLCGPVLYYYPIKQGMHDGVLSKGVAISIQYKNEIEL